MRIAFISYEFPPDTGKGGIGTYVKQIAGAMAATGFDIHVFAGSPASECTEITGGYHLHWIQCNGGIDYRSKVVSRFALLHRQSPFDLMESPEIGGNAWDIKKEFPHIPLLVRLHAPNYLVESLKEKYVPFFAKLRFVIGALRRFRWDLGYWRTYSKETDEDYQFILSADYITAPSAAIKDWVVKNWNLLPEKIVVIPNIFLPSDALLQIPISRDFAKKQVIFFGRLNVLKGLVNATKAMKKILKEYPDWQFKVIGDDGNGPYAGISMRRWMIKELKPVLSQVNFVDGVVYEALPAGIADASIVVLPSLFESFSYTCAEAMAAGKAIVASANGGMAMLVQNEKSGLLVNPESVDEIYTNVKGLINDNEKRYQLSINARHRILGDFNAEKLSAQYKAYYQTIAN